MTIPQEFLKKIGTLVPIDEYDDPIITTLKTAIDIFRHISNCPTRFIKTAPKAWDIGHIPAETKMTLWFRSFNIFLGYFEYNVNDLIDEIYEDNPNLSFEDEDFFWELTEERKVRYFGRSSRLRFFL